MTEDKRQQLRDYIAQCGRRCDEMEQIAANCRHEHSRAQFLRYALHWRRAADRATIELIEHLKRS